jgi:hypothetical protein
MEQEPPKQFRKLFERERDALKDFFGETVEVPALPAEVTPERYKEWLKKGLDLHYLPPIEMGQDRGFPGWKRKPGKQFTPEQQYGMDFYGAIAEGKLPADSAKLSGAWLLVDTRPTPRFHDGDQMYAHDFLKPVLEELREKNYLAEFKPKGSRFNITVKELEYPAVHAALAEAFGIADDELHLPRAIDYNYLGNAFYPEWGATDVGEVFADVYDDGAHLLGGFADFGGISFIFMHHVSGRDPFLGFRLFGKFS